MGEAVDTGSLSHFLLFYNHHTFGIAMTDNYILTFPNVKIQEEGTTEKELELFFVKTETQTAIREDGTKNKVTESQKTSITFKEVSMKLNSINVDKEMYKPGCIKAEVILEKNAGTTTQQDNAQKVTESDITTIVSSLLNQAVNVQCDGKSIADGYRVVNIQPRRRLNNSSLQTTLTIYMYSPDKYLDMQKYSKCYTGKRLGKDVLKGILGELETGPYKIKIPLDCLHQQNMLSKEDNDLKDKDEKREGIHPYLVQYNETPYHFLTRSANRCGEFLFYEDGKLWLGLDTSKSDAVTTTIADNKYTNNVNVMDTKWTAAKTGEKLSAKGVRIIEEGDIEDIVYNEYQETEQYGMQSSNYIESADSSKVSDSKTKVQTYEGPSEEYLTKYDAETKEKYSSVWAKKWPSSIYSVLQADDIVDLISKAGSLEAANAFIWGISKGKTEDKYKKDFLEDYTDDFRNEHVGKNNQTHVYEFSVAEEYNISLTRQLYQWCRERAEVAQKRTIFVKLTNNAGIIVKLGDFVNIFGREYVVTKVHHGRILSTLENEYEGITHWFEAVPTLACINAETKTETEQTDENGNKKTVTTKKFSPIYAPALLADNQKRTAAPQRAYVNNTKDPLSLGRIRILYPWQPQKEEKAENKDEEKQDGEEKPKKDPNSLNSSPWIRMAQPFASADGGICFMPQEGDEVMIGYEFDDIERPFIIGAVSSNDNNGGKVSGNNDVICSPNGHKIQFSNPKNSHGFVTGFFPAFGTLAKWGWKPMDVDNLKNSKELAGGIQLTDKFGIYNLDLSTDKRKITIQSPLGSIQMDAFTGITINCPNGDIALKGKNITIEAGDKLSLASGKNIDKQKIYYDEKVHTWESFGWGVLNTLGNTALDVFSGVEDILKLNVIDMKTTRAVMDAILKPINGTMSIRSGRFMQIEAGKGKTELPNIYKEGSEMYKLHESQSNSVWMRFLTKLDKWYDDHLDIPADIQKQTVAIRQMFEDCCPAWADIEIDSVKKNRNEYITAMEGLYKDVTKDTAAEIDTYVTGTVRTEVAKVKINNVALKSTSFENAIKELLTCKLHGSNANAFEDELGGIMDNAEENTKINTYKATVNLAYAETITLTVEDEDPITKAKITRDATAAEKKRYFFYQIIDQLVEDSKLKYYQRKSYNKIFKFPTLSDTDLNSVIKDPKKWEKFIGIVYPMRSWWNTMYGEYCGWSDLVTAWPSSKGIFNSKVSGGVILMADSNTNNHTVTFNMGANPANNLMGEALANEPVNLKAVADGGTATARKILSNIK